MRVVVALGGNALLQRGQPADAESQRRNVAVAVEALADLARERGPRVRGPTKSIGPVYDRGTAESLAAERSWHVRADGPHWRRVVPSPEPRSIVELPTIKVLVEAGVLVVCVGGGGIPVIVDRDGRLRGVEAVIDKDRAAALLARGLDADALLLLTDVAAVERDYGTPQAAPIAHAAIGSLSEARAVLAGRSGTTVRPSDGEVGRLDQVA